MDKIELKKLRDEFGDAGDKMSDEQVIFLSVVPCENFMTPNIDGYMRKGEYVCEISSGHGAGIHMVGVTVVNVETLTHEYELCKSFTSPTKKEAMKNAMDYIKNL